MKENIGVHVNNQKYCNYLQPIGQNTFNVLNSRLSIIDPDWTNKQILDFGCNIGNLIATSNGKIDSKNYLGFDILEQSINIAKNKFPKYHWSYKNIFNNTFNPKGERILPEFDKKFDYILIIGVFTHMCIFEIKHWVNYLKHYLNINGKIIFSIWEDNHYYSYLGFLDRSFGINVEKVKPNCEKSIYLINRKELIVDCDTLENKHYDWIETFYKKEYIVKELNCYNIEHNSWTSHEIYIINYENF